MVKNPLSRAGDTRDVGLIPALGRSHEIGNGNLLQYSCMENSWTEEPCHRELDMTELLTSHIKVWHNFYGTSYTSM